MREAESYSHSPWSTTGVFLFIGRIVRSAKEACSSSTPSWPGEVCQELAHSTCLRYATHLPVDVSSGTVEYLSCDHAVADAAARVGGCCCIVMQLVRRENVPVGGPRPRPADQVAFSGSVKAVHMTINAAKQVMAR
jgi:hypothetical protein